jgi:CheY-like chemotaxis protein
LNILFIEDDKDKIEAVVDYLKLLVQNVSFVIKKSLQSGLEEIVSESKHDLILLDMALPNYDISIEEPEGGSPESFAGLDILLQMKLREIKSRVLVITQFDSFGDNKMTLDELVNQLKRDYSDNYKGTVFFSITSDKWQKDLKEWIEKFKREGDIENTNC